MTQWRRMPVRCFPNYSKIPSFIKAAKTIRKCLILSCGYATSHPSMPSSCTSKCFTIDRNRPISDYQSPNLYDSLLMVLRRIATVNYGSLENTQVTGIVSVLDFLFMFIPNKVSTTSALYSRSALIRLRPWGTCKMMAACLTPGNTCCSSNSLYSQ